MSLVIVIWSGAAGACLTLALIHLLLWWWNRRLGASLWFAGVALSVAMMAGIELAIMHAGDTAKFYQLHRWGHVTFFFTMVCVVGFVQSYFLTGRKWLLWCLVGLRALILLLAFFPGPTFNFSKVTALNPVSFLGDTVMTPKGIATPWESLGNLSGLLLVCYVVDAALRLWRKGDARERQRAVVVAAGVLLFVLSCFINGLLMHHGMAQVPYFITLSFLFVVAAMEVELSRDLYQASSLAAELRENAESMRLAAGAGQLALWRWDIPGDSIWISPGGRDLYGLPPDGPITLQAFLETLHPDDTESTRLAVEQSLAGDGSFRAEYRVVLPDRSERWIGARGQVEFTENHQPLRMRGVSIDITLRKAAELEAAQRRSEVAHISRVTTLSELSGSLAHELNQPLAIILSNAQAAQRLLAQSPPDLAEVADILSDIVAEDRRAGDIIQRLRSMLKREEILLAPVCLNRIVDEVLHIAHSDLTARGVTIVRELAQDLPEVTGDRVQLQQVLLNLMLNAADAMVENPAGSRHLRIITTTDATGATVSIADEGRGLPADPEKLFQPFHTTKPQGLGLGLPICRAIISAHGGRLWAEAGPENGAVFHFNLPVAK